MFCSASGIWNDLFSMVRLYIAFAALLIKLLNKCSDASVQSVPDNAEHIPHSQAKIPDNSIYPIPINAAMAIFTEPSRRGFTALVICHIPKKQSLYYTPSSWRNWKKTKTNGETTPYSLCFPILITRQQRRAGLSTAAHLCAVHPDR